MLYFKRVGIYEEMLSNDLMLNYLYLQQLFEERGKILPLASRLNGDYIERVVL